MKDPLISEENLEKIHLLPNSPTSLYQRLSLLSSQYNFATQLELNQRMQTQGTRTEEERRNPLEEGRRELLRKREELGRRYESEYVKSGRYFY